MYPYAPIRKVPLEYMGIPSSAFSVQLEKSKDGVTKFNEVGVVKQNYLLIPNQEVKDITDELANNTPWQWEVVREFFDGKKYVYTLATMDLKQEVDEGDWMGLGLNVWNSYDGSIAFHLRFMAYRLACLNGMVSQDNFFSYRFKHDQNSEGWERDIARASDMFLNAEESLESFCTNAKPLLSSVNLQKLETIRKGYIRDLPVTTWGKIVDEYLLNEDEYQESTLWNFLNAGTKILWHNDKPTVADYKNNQYFTDRLMQYGKDTALA
jgi:hypothetical protein